MLKISYFYTKKHQMKELISLGRLLWNNAEPFKSERFISSVLNIAGFEVMQFSLQERASHTGAIGAKVEIR